MVIRLELLELRLINMKQPIDRGNAMKDENQLKNVTIVQVAV
jgi:hypothetical protein